MGQSPSALLGSIEDDVERKSEANDALNAMALLAELKQTAFFGDVHYESSIEGDVLLPLDKVVSKGGDTYCNVSAGGDAVGGALEQAVGRLLRADVVSALTTTVSKVLAEAMEEAKTSGERNWCEKRGYSVAVGHLGGVYRANYLLFYYQYRSAVSSTCTNYLVQAWALSSVRVDWLSLNSVNIALEHSFRHAEGEDHDVFRTRIDGIKTLALRDWDDDQVREAALERRKRKAGKGAEAE